MSRHWQVQVWGLFAVLLANYAAQGVYFWHLYYTPAHPLPEPRSALLLGSVLALFLAGFWLYVRGRRPGALVLGGYLALQFGFYVWNLVGGALHGYGWFFHLRNPDPILWAVFAVGYLSLFASGYFLWLVATHPRPALAPARA